MCLYITEILTMPDASSILPLFTKVRVGKVKTGNEHGVFIIKYSLHTRAD